MIEQPKPKATIFRKIATGLGVLVAVALLFFSCLVPIRNYFQGGYEYDLIIPDDCHVVEPAPRFQTQSMPSFALPKKKMDIIIGCDGHEYIWPVEIGDSGEGYGMMERKDLKNLKRRS